MRFYFTFVSFLTYVFFVSGGAYAASADTSTDHLSAPEISLPWKSAKRASVFGQFRFESLQYMTTLPEAKSLTNSQFLSGRITAASYNRDRGSFNWAADLSAGTFFSLKQSYYSVQEVYVSTPVAENTTLSVGRKKHDWSEIDRVWSFGLWQPRYAIDALRPEDQGLTGLFIDYKQDNFQFLAFGSSIFIPTMGPDVREEDGTIKADNRWYRQPSRQSGKISLSYKINTGAQWDLVNQGSFGTRARLGDEESGPWMAMAAGRKPVSDLALQRLVRSVGADSDANIVVSPRVAHHEIVSADVGYQFENVKTSLSYLEDHPERLLPPKDYAVQEFHPVKMYAAQLDWSIKELFSRALQVQLAYLKSLGDQISDIESDGSVSEVTMFVNRYQFSNAARLKVTGPLATLYARPVITKIGYTYDFDQKGSILGLEFQYQWNRTWSYLVGMDMLGSDDPNSTSEGFINTYRANDRIYAGAFYVF